MIISLYYMANFENFVGSKEEPHPNIYLFIISKSLIFSKEFYEISSSPKTAIYSLIYIKDLIFFLIEQSIKGGISNVQSICS